MVGRGANYSNIMSRKFDGNTSLQGVGEEKGYSVENLKKGDILIWNCGYTTRVLANDIYKTIHR